MANVDNVNHPTHYADSCSLECIEAMEIAFGYEAVINFCKCNAFKYLWRHKNKNGTEDLLKAIWYINKGSDLEYRNGLVNSFMELRRCAYTYMKEGKQDENLHELE